MSESSLNVVILGLSITSSWGNRHAATYRGLVRALHDRGHRVVFLERDVPWYRENRDLPQPPYCQTYLYEDLEALRDRFSETIRAADLIIVGSYVPEGVAVGTIVLEKARGITAFYDIDTPVTLAKLRAGDEEYINPGLVGCYDIYLSFSGGPTLKRLEEEFGSPMARPLYCAVDTQDYFPEEHPRRWLMGYLGTYSPDRQPRVAAVGACTPAGHGAVRGRRAALPRRHRLASQRRAGSARGAAGASRVLQLAAAYAECHP